MKNEDKQSVENIDTRFMCRISENIETNSLNGIKKQQYDSEEYIKYYRKKIAKYVKHEFH